MSRSCKATHFTLVCHLRQTHCLIVLLCTTSEACGLPEFHCSPSGSVRTRLRPPAVLDFKRSPARHARHSHAHGEHVPCPGRKAGSAHPLEQARLVVRQRPVVPVAVLLQPVLPLALLQRQKRRCLVLGGAFLLCARKIRLRMKASGCHSARLPKIVDRKFPSLARTCLHMPPVKEPCTPSCMVACKRRPLSEPARAPLLELHS